MRGSNFKKWYYRLYEDVDVRTDWRKKPPKDLEESAEIALSLLSNEHAHLLRWRYVDRLSFATIGKLCKPPVGYTAACRKVETAIQQLCCGGDAYGYMILGKEVMQKEKEIIQKIKEGSLSKEEAMEYYRTVSTRRLRLHRRAYNVLLKECRDTLYDITKYSKYEYGIISYLGRGLTNSVCAACEEFGLYLEDE